MGVLQLYPHPSPRAVMAANRNQHKLEALGDTGPLAPRVALGALCGPACAGSRLRGTQKHSTVLLDLQASCQMEREEHGAMSW